ncbi:MAG TPA: hypothetical protein VGE07_07270 [Herpetosiphonaceae bacterium]
MKTILFVCYGNICRSPLLEALAAARALAEALPLEVRSAGLVAWTGAPATDSMRLAGGELGLDLGAHRARRFSAYHLDQADLVVAATRLQRDEIAGTWPEYAGRVTWLGELAGGGEDIDDPFLQDAATYRRSAEFMRGLLDEAWPEILRRLGLGPAA